jgi:hypothetical protein
MRRLIVLLAPFALVGCSTAEPAMHPQPSYAPIPGAPAPANARLFIDCIDQSIDQRTFDHVSDEGTDMIRFRCQGDAARAFYDGLASRSAEVGSEHVEGHRTYRSTNALNADLFGADFCWSEDGAWGCELNFNAGDFLAGD